MTKHNLSEKNLELEAINKILELGSYDFIDAYKEKFGLDGTFGRQTTAEFTLPRNLKNSLQKLNPNLPKQAIDKAFYQLCEGKTTLNLTRANQHFYQLIKDGVKVFFKNNQGIDCEESVKIIDWHQTKNNEFLAVKQFKVSGEIYNRRCDLIIFINGLPLVLIELKASYKNLIDAFINNITDYKKTVPQIFWHNALIVISNGLQSKIGSISSDYEHFAEWKKINEKDEEGIISLDTVIKGVFAPTKLLDIIENFILYQESKSGLTKIIAKNHQFLGVNNAIENINNRENLQGKLGVFWHTQGSGKSFSMVFLTQKIFRKLSASYTFLIVSDREDLDNQIYKNFVSCGAVIEKEVQAKSRADLKKLLSEDHRNIFTMIQKFGTENQGEIFEELSDRNNIIVITDEAHRSQYNILAMNMRKALPKASFIAFTGTPLMKDDEKTKEVFGDYVSIYDFEKSQKDHATVKLYYENRLPQLQIINEKLGTDIEKIIANAGLTDEEEERFAKTYITHYELITRNDRLEKIAEDLVDHFMNRGFMGKAMFIAIDKATAVKMYDKVKKYWKIYIAELEKQLGTCKLQHKKTIEKKLKYMQETDMAVIVSQSQNEEENLSKKGVDIRPHRVRINKEDLDEKFKDPNHELRIVFVCAMWITGFDAPSVSTLYLDKLLKEHNLMQTIARANRVWQDKPDGIIVDYIGIFGALKKALAIYGKVKIDGSSNIIEDKAELVKILQQIFLETDLFLKNKKIDLNIITQQKDNFKSTQLFGLAVEAILENNNSKDEFLELASKLKVLLKAILPDARAEEYIQKIRIISIIALKIAEVSSSISPEQIEIEKRKIAELSLKVTELFDNSISIDDYEIKDLEPFDLSQIDFEELKIKFVKNDKKKITLENLKSSVRKKIKKLIEINPTKKSYDEKFEELVNNYNSRDIDAEKFLIELINLSQNLTLEENRHLRENLSKDELVVFDILTKPEPKLNQNEIEIVKSVAKDLLKKLKQEKLVLDWKKEQSSRAKVKNAIKEVCDKLPKTYDEIYQNKCEDLYLYFYDYYQNDNERISF